MNCHHIGRVTYAGRSKTKTYYESEELKKILQLDDHYWINVEQDYPHDLPAVGDEVRAVINVRANASRREGRDGLVDHYPYLVKTVAFDPFA